MQIPRVVRPFQDFFRLEAVGGMLLLFSAAVALAWANSPWADLYAQIWHTPVTFGFGDAVHARDIRHWVNDGLMAVFFFVVALEIKREMLVGELATPNRAALPAFAAIGGMIVPASIYLAFNLGTSTVDGWGIPMATDIAFALGILALLGDRVPLSLKVFLAALAIVDDLGAVVIIAIFYTSEIHTTLLLVAVTVFLAMVLMNAARVRSPTIYGALAFALWVALLDSGIHATIAGVLAALTIPSSARINAGVFRSRSRELLDRLEAADAEPNTHMLTGEQQESVYSLAALVEQLKTPLQRFEHRLHPWVALVIMPVFALANAGVELGDGLADALTRPTTIGVAAGLVIGKLAGVMGFAWVAVASGIAVLPRGVTWRQLAGASALAGVGFTMSLFIAGLAFGDTPALELAKIGVLLASVVAGVLGVVLLLMASKGRPD